MKVITTLLIERYLKQKKYDPTIGFKETVHLACLHKNTELKSDKIMVFMLS